MDLAIPAAMQRCLELAGQGRGRVGINPLVGAVLLRNGSIVAEGWHTRFGGPHAERSLFEGFAEPVLPDDVLVVNLEPCCHREKKTPPCTDLLIERGVRQIVIGMADPNPAVAGRGIARLKEAGADVVVGIERARCEWLNRGFQSLQQRGRPWVTVKQARTPDGRVALPDGSPLTITDPEQDAWAHTWLRARHDAILVGRGTVQRDDPQLTARHVSNKKFDQFQPLRIVLDPRLELPMDARIVTGEPATGTLVVCSGDADPGRADTLAQRGVRVLRVPLAGRGFAWDALWSALTTPAEGFPGLASILVEGGPATWAHFRAAGMVDAEVLLTGDS